MARAKTITTTQEKVINNWIDELEDAQAFLKRQLKTTQDNLAQVAERLEALKAAKANLELSANVKKEI